MRALYRSARSKTKSAVLFVCLLFAGMAPGWICCTASFARCHSLARKLHDSGEKFEICGMFHHTADILRKSYQFRNDTVVGVPHVLLLYPRAQQQLE